MSYVLNVDEQMPMYFYVFVDGLSPMQKHNFRLRKGIVSGAFLNLGIDNDFIAKYQSGDADYLPFIPNFKTDIHSPSSYSMQTTLNYSLEYNAELFRKQNNDTKIYPSRLSCVYAFGDMETCIAVSKEHGWNINSVKKFKLEPNPLDLNRVVKVNMEIVSLMRSVGWNATFSQSDIDHIWQHYWKGRGDLRLEVPAADMSSMKTVNSDVIWEYLIEGQLTQVAE
jgi:hypothetical protein